MYLKQLVRHSICCVVLLLCALLSKGQDNPINKIQQGLPNFSGQGGARDSLQHRNRNEDSISIYYRYLDTATAHKLDSSISDYNTRFPIPYTFQYLGNIGSAANSILFQPLQTPGWDPGFHAYDVYRWTSEKARFFNTTRPYTELTYSIATGTQQNIEILHTQNIKPNWNFALNYRLLNGPGYFNNQKTDHNNYLLTSWYQSNNKRYNNFVAFVGNKLQAAENGGILSNENYLDDPKFSDRFGIPTKLATGTSFARDFFSSSLTTGNRYNTFNAVVRQQYDFGKKDSLVTDSTVIPLFFPRLRVEHTFTYGEYKYTYEDTKPDSVFYSYAYGMTIPAKNDTLFFRDKWKEIKNDISIYQFPDAKNLQQYIKVGIEWQALTGILKEDVHYFNTSLHGEYRNRTRSQKWDMAAAGQLYLTGYNSGDFHAFVSLQRLLSDRFGSLQVGFENSNRTPSFMYDTRSNFYLDAPKTFYKENNLRLFANIYEPKLKMQLGAEYYFITNYLYFTGYKTLAQQSDVFNLLRLKAQKKFRVTKHWGLYSDVYLQQTAGNAAVHVPLFFTRQRLEYEGNFGYKNLNVAFGIEARYHSPYKADAYSPVLGQFSYQDTAVIKNRPDINAFFNFRIRGFKAFVRVENLNTLRFSNGGGFKQENFAAPDYPYPGLVIRFGVYWSFVN